jgi:subtilase family serine protease
MVAAPLVVTAVAMPARPTAHARSDGLALADVRIFPMVRVSKSYPSGPLPGGYTPKQIRAAYDVAPLLNAGINGRGQTIVIVDSFGSPTIRHDLDVFDDRFGLADPPALRIIHPAGPIPAFNPNSRFMPGWASETTLDVEWAHVMAPDARILLVETPTSENEGTSGFPQIVSSEKYVIRHHLGGVISQSFGATEETFPTGTLRPLRGAYKLAASTRHGPTVVSASGDAGATDLLSNLSCCYAFRVTSWPASDPLVTSVGGTDLTLDGLGNRIVPDAVWNDGGASAGGGGRSIVFGRPSYQDGVAAIVGRHRGVPDVSLSASCSHAVDVYASFPRAGGWQTICGTSEATPLFAGILALADQKAGHPLGPIGKYLYTMARAHDPGIVDITRGNNSVSFVNGQGHLVRVRGWRAVPGYDLASGLGTIDAAKFVPELALLAG